MATKTAPASFNIKAAETSRTVFSDLLVLKRDQSTFCCYDREKIRLALEKAFRSCLAQDEFNLPQSLAEITESLTKDIEQRLEPLARCQLPINVEKIQDLLEEQLMTDGHHRVAKAFILYRQSRAQERSTLSQKSGIRLQITPENFLPLNEQVIASFLVPCVVGLDSVSAQPVVQETLNNIYDGVTVSELYQALIMATRSLIEQEPNYSFVAARLLLTSLKREALGYLDIESYIEPEESYRTAFIRFIEKGVANEILNPELLNFPLKELAESLKIERDDKFQYLGLQTLYDRYFIHYHKTRYELPQVFFMRVAMGLALEEENRLEKTLEFYNLLSSFDFMSSTPTLFNSATTRSQLSSCFLSTVQDNLFDIYGAIRDNAMLSKFAGGLGNDWTNVRGMNAHIKGTNGSSQGVIPFLKVVNDTAIAVNQGGKRKGAVCSYLEAWHRDVEEFLELRKNTGEERRRTHDMNTALWVPDLLMERVRDGAQWTLFSPDETPDLHDLYGLEFKKRYEEYEALAEKGKIKNVRTISAKNLWRKTLGMIFETGHPWITFKDPCNLRSPQQHAGVVHSSNLCTEITLNTSADEIAVCNLGSINLPAHIKDGKIDTTKLKKTVNTAIRMLDNVIDINYYSVEAARNSNMKHRPIGMGLMGFQDALYMMGVPYESAEAITFADTSMELISYYAIEASCDLAQERGAYETFQGSLWSKGIVPLDSLKILADSRRSRDITPNFDSRLDWDMLRERVKKGVRNSNLMAIAPTATIANICGVTQSIEPNYQNLFVKSNLSGEFTVINPYLVDALKEQGLWDQAMLHDLKYYNGQLQEIDRIPSSIKNIFKTAFEIDPKALISAGSRRQKWIDQSQSLNLYISRPSGKLIDEVYQYAWQMALKTTYYCRTLGATDAERSTINDRKLNAVSVNPQASTAACSIDNPDCEACQ